MMHHERLRGARGSVFAYILAAIFLTGLLVITVSGGPGRSAVTVELDDLVNNMAVDITTVEAAIMNCTLQHPAKVDEDGDGADDNGNPNVPQPLYDDSGTMHGGDGSDDDGAALAALRCPGAPGMPLVFNGGAGQELRFLSDAATWEALYFNNAQEGAYVRIRRAAADPLWTEAMARLDEKYSECKAAPDSTGDCANGCFYYWIVRRSTSEAAAEAGCP